MARRLPFALLALLGLMPAAVLADTPTNSPVPAPTTAPRPQAPPPSIFELAADGTATHLQSLLQCPASLDGYTRDDLHVYDGIGFDVSCNYRGSESDVTIYLARRGPALLAATFESARQLILKRFPDAVPRDKTMPPPPGPEWKAASFASRGGAQLDDVMMADISGWQYEVRATYLDQSAAAVEKVTADLTAQMLAGAGAHLAACAAAPAPARTGTAVSGVDYLGTLALAGIAMARLGPQGAAPVWCAEGNFTFGQDHPLLWRNIGFDGKTGFADRITSANARLVEVPLDPASGEIASKQGAPMAVYDVLLEDADKIDLIGIYDGRPGPGELARLLSSNPLHFLIRFDKTANRIDIPTATLHAGDKPAAPNSPAPPLSP